MENYEYKNNEMYQPLCMVLKYCFLKNIFLFCTWYNTYIHTCAILYLFKAYKILSYSNFSNVLMLSITWLNLAQGSFLMLPLQWNQQSSMQWLFVKSNPQALLCMDSSKTTWLKATTPCMIVIKGQVILLQPNFTNWDLSIDFLLRNTDYFYD